LFTSEVTLLNTETNSSGMIQNRSEMYHGLMSITVQQDATIYSFIKFSANSSMCFGWYRHPSSGAHSNCNYNIRHWSNRICYRPLTWRSRNSDWWIRVSSETCRDVCRKYNKTVYSCILLDSYWQWFTMHGPMNIKVSWIMKFEWEERGSNYAWKVYKTYFKPILSEAQRQPTFKMLRTTEKSRQWTT